jgi:hypothetical protein
VQVWERRRQARNGTSAHHRKAQAKTLQFLGHLQQRLDSLLQVHVNMLVTIHHPWAMRYVQAQGFNARAKINLVFSLEEIREQLFMVKGGEGDISCDEGGEETGELFDLGGGRNKGNVVVFFPALAEDGVFEGVLVGKAEGSEVGEVALGHLLMFVFMGGIFWGYLRG